MKLQVVFSTANFVYKLKKSENFENRRYNLIFVFSNSAYTIRMILPVDIISHIVRNYLSFKDVI